MLCVFASCFSKWVCGGGLQHMCWQINENVFLMLLWVKLSQTLYKTSMGLYIALGEKLSAKHRYILAKVLCVLTAPATLTHISDSEIAEGRYSQQTEWKTYWQLTHVILNAYACNGALDDTPQSKRPSMASMIKRPVPVCACYRHDMTCPSESVWKKHSINGTEGICGN